MPTFLTYGLVCIPLIILVVVIWVLSDNPQYVPMTPTEEREYLRGQGMSDIEIDELLEFCERNGR